MIKYCDYIKINCEFSDEYAIIVIYNLNLSVKCPGKDLLKMISFSVAISFFMWLIK